MQLRNISHIRRFLTTDVCTTLTCSLIMSRLDYCNSLLHGISSALLSKLQKVQNNAARVITHTERHCHITPILKALYWLPIESRIHYKLLLYTYKALHELAPSYIIDLLPQHVRSKPLRSQVATQLMIPRTNTVTYGDRDFSHAAPVLWNSLPAPLRNTHELIAFKKALKTHLFLQAYD